jgi:hypothetical protein
MASPPWLVSAKNPKYQENCYNGHYIVEKITTPLVIELLPGGLIVIDQTNMLSVKFAVLTPVSGYVNDAGEVFTEANCLMWGEGPSENLRECRHTYWGDEENSGYIFYPSGPLITAVFERLSAFFDDMI